MAGLEISPFPPNLKCLEGNPIKTKLADRNNINVYYYGHSYLALEANGHKFEFYGATDDTPTMNTMSFTDIEFANSRSPVFYTGQLVFGENEREEMFLALGKPNWKETYWSEEDIENVLLRPTVESLNRMLRIRDIHTIERIRGRMTKLKNTALQRPSERVITLVNIRFDEILSGKMVSSKTVTTADAGITPAMEENKVLKEQLTKQQEEFARQMAAMQAEIQKLKEQAPATVVIEPEPKPAPKKPAGRQPKKTT